MLGTAHSGQAVSGPLLSLTNVIKKRGPACTLFQYMETAGAENSFEQSLKNAFGKHVIVGIRVYDRRDAELPDVGVMELQDAETGVKLWVDTSLRSVRESYRRAWEENSRRLQSALARSRVDSVSVATDEDYVKALIKLFKRR